MKKVLIFWLWFQWAKYVKYFNKEWFEVYSVTKSWNNKKNILGVSTIYSFNFVRYLNKDFFDDFTYIILTVKPIKEQETIITFLLKLELNIKIIIEKPVSKSLDLLKALENNNNYYYFIDELVLYSNYKKIFNNNNIIVKSDNDSDILEHALGTFLLFDKFKIILDNLKLFYIYEDKYSNVLKYQLINEKYSIICNWWTFNINGKEFYSLSFWKSLDFLLSLDSSLNLLCKRNYIFLTEFLLNIKINKNNK